MGDPSKSTPTIKYDWYQSETHTVITILLKNANEEYTKADYDKYQLIFTSKLPSGDDYILKLNLCNEVVPEQCSLKIYQTKVEIKLKKAVGIRWDTLERQEQDIKVTISKDILTSASTCGIPRYPTSNPKQVDWDAIEREITKEEKSEKPEGEAALNALFQKIYGQGSDEVKKAMNKSFLESGGTVLSTNWDEVSNSPVECKPPDGMEFKKWA